MGSHAIIPRTNFSALIGGSDVASEQKFKELIGGKRRSLETAVRDVNEHVHTYCSQEIAQVEAAHRNLESKVRELEGKDDFKQKVATLTRETRDFEDVMHDVNNAYRAYARAISDRRDLSREQQRALLKSAQQRIVNNMMTDEERQLFENALSNGGQMMLGMF